MIKDIPPIPNLELGESYHRWSLHEDYGGSPYRGISPSGSHPYIFVFTGDAGEEHGYKDEFRGETFLYTGEGREGDMNWSIGNKALRDHKQGGREIHLFESNEEAWGVTYIGQYECVDWFEERLPDTHGNLRKAIRFKLEPVDNEIEIEESNLKDVDTNELYQRAKKAAESHNGIDQRASVMETTRTTYSCSDVVREYALRMADGICQGCDEPAPFIGKDGEPFLEVHHLHRRTDGGPDHPDNVIALCPNCHRRIHHGSDGNDFNQYLIDQVY